MINPTAFDDIGILMLDSIREIFDILGIQYEWIRFKIKKFNIEKDLKQLEDAIKAEKCPVIGVPHSCWPDAKPEAKGGHVMVAIDIKKDVTTGVQKIQMKNTYADKPHIPGKVRHKQLISPIATIDYGSQPMIHGRFR